MLPPAFENATRTLLGDDEYQALAQVITQHEAPTSIRLNPTKWQGPPPPLRPVPWEVGGYYLDQRIAFTFDPLLHAGAYYVQEASSMFIGEVIRQYIPTAVRYLDMCAAPGGKTTHALSMLPKGSWVVANEMIRSRAHILAENLIKWGNPHIVVTNNKAEDFVQLPHLFEVILTDVPCSGEGMFRKDPLSIDEWSPDNVARCVTRQREIIDSLWESLAPGGVWIYTTCTYNPHENEEQIAYLEARYGATSLPVTIDPSWGITPALTGNLTAYRFMPHKTRGEGFFAALLRKPDDQPHIDSFRRQAKREKSVTSSITPQQMAEAQRFINAPEEVTYRIEGDTIRAIPTADLPGYLLVSERLNIVEAGIHVATCKGRDLLPAHPLALSLWLNTQAVTSVEVDYPTAIAYLRREAILLPENTPKGHLLITYQNYPLGWVKHIGNRTNNMYPSEWRIRSSHVPLLPPCFIV